MDIITSAAYYRQRVVRRSYKIGVTKASIYYQVSRKTIYEWRKRYDGNVNSLREKSHRPKHHPKEHTEEEKEMILRRYPRYKEDKIRLWDSLRKEGYTRTYYSMLRVIRKWVEPEIERRRVRKPKPYQRAEYPGQKVQVDVKYVPELCVSNGVKYYQYTAVDECTRWTYRKMYDEHSTYSSTDFLIHLVKAFPVPIREIQTDNGAEFTKAFISNDPNDLSLFEEKLKEYDIYYHRIKVATPRHNGKVERQHREDQKRFYDKMRMFNLNDGRVQLERYNRFSNNIPKVCIGFLSPNDLMSKYLAVIC